MQFVEQSRMNTFITFVRADKRYAGYYAKSRQRKAGAVTGGMNFPLLRYLFSLERRIAEVYKIFATINKLNELAIQEERAQAGSKPGTILHYPNHAALVLNFEVLTDQIYKTFETVAKVNPFMFRTGHPMARSFLKQRKAILAGGSINTDYDHAVSQMDWYDDIMRLRHNNTHYLSGMGVWLRNEKEETIPGYLTFIVIEEGPENLSEEDEQVEKVEFPILEKATETVNYFTNSIDEIGACYLKLLNETAKCQVPVLNGNHLEFVEMSLEEYNSRSVNSDQNQ